VEASQCVQVFCFAQRRRSRDGATFMPAEPIQFYHRYSKSVETEKVFGERWLRLAYETPVGRLFVWLIARRKLFSWWYGRKMSQRASANRILPFISAYNIDVDEFAKSPFDYKTFNEFFYRALKPGARPIAEGDNVAVFPADGRHLVFPNVETVPGFYVKGASFTLAELFDEDAADPASRPLSTKFAGGGMLISRLCPVDYHRFHFPVSGELTGPRLINGWLYSVSPVALRRSLHFLVQNKRMLTLIESPVFGTVAMFEVGATNVGSIQQTHIPGRAAVKGEQKGLFAFGGSCVITVFQRDCIRFDDDLVEPSGRHLEVYARMGDRLGVSS
jgi:phosphatidylserine decarboxylase